MILDFATALAPMLRGKTSSRRIGQQWDNAWKGDAMSAMCGGQWSQVKKASVPAFGIDDVRCQLCPSEPGAVLHRFSCPATEQGCALQPPQPAAALAARTLSDDRLRIAKTRALVSLRLPEPPTRQQGIYRWHAEPNWDSVALTDAVWYCDGSMLQGRLAALRTTVFGIAVVASNGHLLGFGSGRPPARCSTAAATEAYAMLTVLQLNGFTPNIRTDCQSLLTTALAGTTRATSGSKVLARIWKDIADILDEDISVLVRDGKLVWQPAHCSRASVGQAKLSNGARVSPADWRANRLVDRLAKNAAAFHVLTKSAANLIHSIAKFAQHSLARLRVYGSAKDKKRQSKPQPPPRDLASVKPWQPEPVLDEKVRRPKVRTTAAYARTAAHTERFKDSVSRLASTMAEAQGDEANLLDNGAKANAIDAPATAKAQLTELNPDNP